MNSEETPFTARTDFPVKRMLRMFVYGNMMTTGGIFLLGVSALVFQGIFFYINYQNSLPRISFIAKEINGSCDELIDLVITYPGILVVLFAIGGLASMIWYVVARRIETREMKKRWLVIAKRQQ